MSKQKQLGPYVVSDLLPGARACVEYYARITDHDQVLIISDKPLIMDALVQAIRGVSENANVDCVYLSPSMRPLRAITPVLTKALFQATVVYSAFSLHVDELNFRMQITASPSASGRRRVFHMVSVNEAMFAGEGALGLSPSQFQQMESLTFDLAIALTIAKEVKIESAVFSETSLRLSLGDSENVGFASTGRVEPGHWGNLPSGEAFIMPVWADGNIVIDKAVSVLDPGFKPFALQISDSHIHVEQSTNASFASRLAHYEAVSEEAGLPIENVRRVCELGFGTNPNATTSTFIEIEKILGTVHIAIGDNTGFGGEVQAPNHIDMVIGDPTVTLDNEHTILAGGKVHRQVLHDFLAMDYSSLDPNGIAMEDVVERVPGRALDDGKLLHRWWQNKRGNRLETLVGSEVTAQMAREVWECFKGAKEAAVGQVAERFDDGYGIEQPHDQVRQVLRVMERFGVVSVSRDGAFHNR